LNFYKVDKYLLSAYFSFSDNQDSNAKIPRPDVAPPGPIDEAAALAKGIPNPGLNLFRLNFNL